MKVAKSYIKLPLIISLCLRIRMNSNRIWTKFHFQIISMPSSRFPNHELQPPRKSNQNQKFHQSSVRFWGWAQSSLTNIWNSSFREFRVFEVLIVIVVQSSEQLRNIVVFMRAFDWKCLLRRKQINYQKKIME